MDDTEASQRIEIVLDEFAEALLYNPSGDDDATFFTLLAALASRLGYVRVARLAYECVATAPAASGTGLQSILDSAKLTSPLDIQIIQSLYILCRQIHDEATLNSRPQLFSRVAPNKSIPQLLPPRPPDLSFFGDNPLPRTENYKIPVIPSKINLLSPDWVSLINVVQDHVLNLTGQSKSKKKLACSEDPYENSLRPSYPITFNVPDLSQQDLKPSLVTESPEIAEPEQQQPMENNDTPKGTSIEKEKSEEPQPPEQSASSSSSSTTKNNTPEIPAENKKRKSESISLEPQDPPKARSSKRFKLQEKTNSLSDADFTEDDAFFDQMKTFLKPCSFSFVTISPVFSRDEPKNPSDQYIYDFKQELLNWDAPQVEVLAAMKAEINSDTIVQDDTHDPQNSNAISQPLLAQLLDSPSSATSTVQIPESSRPTTLPPSSTSVAFVQSVLASRPHIQEVRVNLVRALCGVQPENELSPILTQIWPLNAITSLGHLVCHVEPLLQEYPSSYVSQAVELGTLLDTFCEVAITQTILEIIANESFGISKLLRKPETLSKASIKDLSAKQSALEERYLSWRRIFCDLVAVSSERTQTRFQNIVLRNQWTNLLVSKSITADAFADNGDDFSDIIKELEAVNPSLEITYPNFVHIPPFSLVSIRNQLSRFRAMATLSEIFKDPVEEASSAIKEAQEEKPVDSSTTTEKKKDSKQKNKVKGKVDKEKDEERKKQEEERKRLEKEERERRKKELEEQKARNKLLSIEASKKRISLLERILFPEKPDDPDVVMEDDPLLKPLEKPEDEYKAISLYLSRASLDLRLKFWNLLLDDYQNAGESQKSLDGYLAIFCDIVKELTSHKYKTLAPEQRPIVLLRAVYMCHNAAKNMMALDLSITSFSHLSQTSLRAAMSAILALLRLLYVYVLFEDGIVNAVINAPSHPAWEKAANIMKELTVRSWCLFYYLYQALVPTSTTETLHEILSIIHEQLGNRGYCGLADGVLLGLIFNELIRLNPKDSESDMIQCLHCRYNVVIASEDFHPYDHSTKPIELDKSTALKILEFVLGILIKKKNLSQSILRAEVKGVLDELFEAIQFPSSSSTPTISRNAFILTGIMEMRVDVPFLKMCFNGNHPISFVDTPKEIDSLAKSGLYFLLGQSRMQLYKVRKRTMQGRTEDVAEAIKFLKYDLMCGGYNRFETWYLLAQGYDALVEDDLTWNTDKISVPDSRNVTVARQKKTLICAGMAINRLLQQQGKSSELLANSPSYHNMLQSVWSFFARLLFNSTQCPMDMAAFYQMGERMLCGMEGLYTREPVYKLKPAVIIKSALLALKVSEREELDWYTLYLKGQMLHKLKSSHETVLDIYTKSMELAPEKHTRDCDSVLEPHYKFVSCVYKYLHSGVITNAQALEYLSKCAYADNTGDNPIVIESPDKPENNEAYSLCAAALIKIRSADKKKWHHRPTYRLARIYDEAGGDFLKAKDELSAFFQLKVTSKTPIQIWKTEYERPGQHFEYVRQYIVFFIDLLGRTQDVEMFGLLSKCLRKFKSGMLRHQETWEFMCSTVARVCKSDAVLGIPARYADSTISRIVFEDFARNAAKMLDYNEKTATPLHPLTKFLNYTAELRRLNNGFGSTAALDDLFVSIYLIIYCDFVDEVLPEEELKEKKKREEAAAAAAAAAAKASALQTPSTKISVMDLLSDPVTPDSNETPPPAPTDTKQKSGKGLKSIKVVWPESDKKKTSSPGAGSNGSTGSTTTSSSKVRVTRRDIISRSLALLRVCLSKLVAADSLKITKANTPMPCRVESRSIELALAAEEQMEKERLMAEEMEKTHKVKDLTAHKDEEPRKRRRRKQHKDEDSFTSTNGNKGDDTTSVVVEPKAETQHEPYSNAPTLLTDGEDEEVVRVVGNGRDSEVATLESAVTSPRPFKPSISSLLDPDPEPLPTTAGSKVSPPRAKSSPVQETRQNKEKYPGQQRQYYEEGVRDDRYSRGQPESAAQSGYYSQEYYRRGTYAQSEYSQSGYYNQQYYERQQQHDGSRYYESHDAQKQQRYDGYESQQRSSEVNPIVQSTTAQSTTTQAPQQATAQESLHESEAENEPKPSSRHSDWFNTIIGKSSEAPIELD